MLRSLIVFVILVLLLPIANMCLARGDGHRGPGGGGDRPWERRRGEMQDGIGGVPKEILEQQSKEPVKPLALEKAFDVARAAARKAAQPLIDEKYHTGKRLRVPGDFRTIQAAIDAARPRDVVVVGPGTWYELLEMKDGVRLCSDSTGNGDELIPVKDAKLRLPRRALVTILDGSRAKPSRHGMIDFAPGSGRHTVVDGLTIRNLPRQNHHVPGHAHGLNVRGASPVIMNCLIEKNGSTGIGNHVVYRDQASPLAERDFRWANIEHQASPVIYRNILRANFGLGIGCNHFSTPFILGNEILRNDDSELGEETTPGLGMKHGAAPTVVGNLIHDNPGGGALAKAGAPQGEHNIDRPTCPTIRENVVFRNGEPKPAIGLNGVGSKEKPATVTGNLVYDSGGVGIGLFGGAFAVVTENTISGSKLSGIAVNASTAIVLDKNRVRGAQASGFVIVAGAKVLRMVGNASEGNRGPRFVMQGSTIAGKGQ